MKTREILERWQGVYSQVLTLMRSEKKEVGEPVILKKARLETRSHVHIIIPLWFSPLVVISYSHLIARRCNRIPVVKVYPLFLELELGAAAAGLTTVVVRRD